MTTMLNGFFVMRTVPCRDDEKFRLNLQSFQPAQQFVAKVCSSLIKRALSKEVPVITKNSIGKSLVDLQQTFINSSVAALEKRGIQIYKLLESMLKTNKESAKNKDKDQQDKPITTQDLLTRKRNSH